MVLSDDLSESATTLMVLYLANLCYALPKRSLPASFPFMKDSLRLSNKDYGNFSAGFSLGYGLFKLIGGVMTDFVSAHRLFACGLMAASLLNCIFPQVINLMNEDFYDNVDKNGSIINDSSMVHIVWIFWTLNGVLQGVGGPALSKVVIQNFSSSRRSAIWSNLHSANNIGYLISPYLLLVQISQFGWKGPFWFVGLSGVAVSVSCFLFPLNGSTNATSLPSQNNDFSHANGQPKKKKSFTSYTLRDIAMVVSLIFSNALTYFILKTISDWQVLYMMEVYLFNYEWAITLSFCTEIGAIAGSIFSSIATEQFRHSKIFVCFMFSIFSLFCFVIQLLVSYMNVSHSNHSSLICKGVIFAASVGASVGLNGPKAILFLEATEKSLELVEMMGFASKNGSQYAGSLSGVIGLWAQIGASCSGNVVGRYLAIYGWSHYIPVQVFSTFGLVGLLGFSFFSENSNKLIRPKEE